MPRFEFRIYDEEAKFLRSEIDERPNEAAAKAAAGRRAKRSGGPVDLARSTDEPWSKRYMTTASPEPFASQGYRLERLES